jgi:hypothetical protein
MFIQQRSIQSLKEEFLFSFRNHSGDLVTKFTPTSVGNAVVYALSKLVAKINSDGLVIERKLFPETAQGNDLDSVATREGFGIRLSATPGKTILCFYASSGVTYNSGFVVKSTTGVLYQTIESLTIGSCKFGFAEAVSQETGTHVAVAKNSLITPSTTPPANHERVFNIIPSYYQNEEEGDYTLRSKISNVGQDFFLTLEEYLAMVFCSSGVNVIRIAIAKQNDVYHNSLIYVLKRDATDFTSQQLIDMWTSLKQHFSLSDYVNDNVYLQNFSFTPFDVVLYVIPSSDTTSVLQDILRDVQVSLLHYLDCSVWPFERSVHRDEILSIGRGVTNVLDVVDSKCTPLRDIILSMDRLPKLNTVTIVNAKTDAVYTSSVNPFLGLARMNDRQNKRASYLS